MLSLERPLCFFDIESTGTDVAKDRIVELFILKVTSGHKKESKQWLVNPTIRIPDEVIAIHGITNEEVADSPTFADCAKEIHDFIKDCDLAGYNSNRFDIPMLGEELMRSSIRLDVHNIAKVDVQNIFHKKEPRNLEAAYRFYCDKELTNSHSAKHDTVATYEILVAQLEKYNDLPKDIKSLARFSTYHKTADLAGFIGYNAAGEPILNFGKNKNKTLYRLIKNDPGYIQWILQADFPLYTKKFISAMVEELTDNKS